MTAAAQRPGGYAPASGVREEARLLLALAVPVAIARVSMLTMGLVDTWMVGSLGDGKTDLAAVGLADACFFTLIVVAAGTIRALDPMISQAHGAGDVERSAGALRAGLRLAAVLSLPLALAVFGMRSLLGPVFGQPPDVVRSASLYLAPVALGIPAQLFFVAHCSFVQSLGDTRAPMVVALLANVVNVFLDWALIFGNAGAPALGVAGAGLASAGCRWFMCLALWLYVRRSPRFAAYRGRGRGVRGLSRTALRVGLPIGLAQGVEVSAFALAAIFMGRLGTAALAAHQIAIKMVATSFMFAIALGVATGIRVGNGIGAGRPREAERSAWVGLGSGLFVMSCLGVVYFFAGRWIVASFTSDPDVIAVGASLMAVAAAFQLSDGTQAIAAGALRGAGKTLQPLAIQIVAFWCFAIPLAYVFAFTLGWGPTGVWWALAFGLTVAAGLLLVPVRGIRRIEAIV